MVKQKSSILTDRTVLIADDDAVVRGLLRALLRVAGLQVIAEAANGERTLEAYKAHHPQIVCLDIDMPGMSGLEVLAQIRAQSTRTVIVIISAETTLENTRKAMSEKADGIIAKPFNMVRVMSELERVLRGRLGSQSSARPD